MPRYVAFLRGVSPMNLKMSDLKHALEAAGFTNVRTLLSSGNAIFDALAASRESLAKKVEACLAKTLGKSFLTIVQPQEDLKALLESDPYKTIRLPKGSKRVITFLRAAPAVKVKTPVKLANAVIHTLVGTEVFSSYVPDVKQGPVFMALLEKTFGKEVTTRTWDTVRKCAAG